MQKTLHTYYNGKSLDIETDDIVSMTRHSAEDDAKWGHIDAKPYTAITLEAGKKTSEGVGTAYVSEMPEDILAP